MVVLVSERTFTQEVLESPIAVLVNFWAPWCRPCQLIQPMLLEFQTECNGQIKIVSVNADENFKLSNNFRITNLPTLILIENGEILERIDKIWGKDDLRHKLEEIRVNYVQRLKTYTDLQTAAVDALV